jgi:hypothetical protein
MSQIYKDIISENLYNIVADFINAQEDFTFIVHNNNNWNVELPERLKKENQFVLNVDKQTLEDSYVEDGKIIINTKFDDVEYSKEFDFCDIGGIMGPDRKTPIFIKPFQEKPEIEKPVKPLNGDIDEDGIRHSMEMWKKNNPELF